MEIIIKSEKQMERFGFALGHLLEIGDIVGLTGDLGAGKTTLTKAVAKGMGINEHITSPTFTIVNEYEGRLPLYHFDVYRLNDEEELHEIGYEEYFFSKAACVVEWANLIPNLMPEETLWLDLRLGTEDPEERCIHLKYENHWKIRVENMLKELAL
jgi:tRNA threonylcarbamoyladenosine biosynthesis protein TsaE